MALNKLFYCPSVGGGSIFWFHTSKCFLKRVDLFVKDNCHSIWNWRSFNYSYQITILISLTNRGGKSGQFTKVLLPQEEFNECVWVNVFWTVPLTQEKMFPFCFHQCWLFAIPCSLIHSPLTVRLIFLKLRSLLILKHFEKSPLTSWTSSIKFKTLLYLSHPFNLKSELFLMYSFHVAYVTFTVKRNYWFPKYAHFPVSVPYIQNWAPLSVLHFAELILFPCCGLTAFPLKPALSTT